MNRIEASSLTRKLLNEHGLNDWHVRLTMDLRKPFLGMCSAQDKCIILNAHHIDTHPDVEVVDTIRHEIAHALTPGHGHDDTWKEKAKQLGATPEPCSTMAIDPRIVNEIRSGADVVVEFTEETRVIRTPKYTVTRLQNKCKDCGKVAEIKEQKIVPTSKGRKKLITLKCNHIILEDAESTSPFEAITFDGRPDCKHHWGIGKQRTTCKACGARRLYDYQIKGAQFLEEANGRGALFDEQGLGKTIQALAYLKYHEHDGWPYLWVTKSGIKYQHIKEIIRVLGKKAFPQVLHKGTDTLIPGMSGYICSYDLFRRFNDLDMFKTVGVKTVVLDECQAIKNPDSSRTQSIRKAVRELPKIIPTSGTPWKNRGSEFFVVLNLLDPKLFNNYERFKRDWVAEYFQGNRIKEGGIRNPEQFRETIKHIALRRERKEVMPELPIISRNKLMVEVPDHVKKTYDEEADKLIAVYNQAVLEGTEDSFETRKKMMENLIVMRQIVGLAKVDGTCEFAQEFLEETDRKLVIFVHHKSCAREITDRMKIWCSENNIAQPVILSAELSSEERFAVQEKFNSPYTRLMIASTLASGEGLNLQTCSDCVMHERQWNPANEEQAEGRFIRIGQAATAVTATYVHAEDTIDLDLDNIVEPKRREYENSMNKGGYINTWNQESIENQLIESIIKNRKKNKVA